MRSKGFQTILIVATILLFLLVNNKPIRTNLYLSCIVQHRMKNFDLTDECYPDSSELTNSENKTVALIDAAMRLDDLASESQSQIGPSEWEIDIDSCIETADQLDNPQESLIQFYELIIDAHLTGDYLIKYVDCSLGLPPSFYINDVAKNEDIVGFPIEFRDAGLLIAYESNSGWIFPYQLIRNASDVGQLFVEKGEYKQSEEAFTRALNEIRKDDTRNFEIDEAVLLASLGEIAEVGDRETIANEFYAESLATMPENNRKAVYGYTRTISSLDENEDIEAILDKLGSLLNEHPNLIYEFAAVFESNDQDDLLRNIVVRDQRIDRHDCGYDHAAMGIYSKSIGDLGGAETYFSQILSEIENNECQSLFLSEIAARLAIVQILQQEWDDAIKSQELAVTYAPNRAYFWYDLSTYYVHQGRFRDALEAVDFALALEPNVEDFIALKSELQVDADN